jgi:monofunctional biosynthetic peptidoglycan transglycosylase
VLRRLVRLAVLLLLAYPALVLVLTLAYIVVPPVSTLMLARWFSGESVARTYVPLESISRQLPSAVIASEDARFCQHGGVDWSALHDVISDEDGPSRGASTIPMQVAKNLFLWPSRSYVRKALEIPLAIVLDLVWSKRRMIEIYLNVAEWGEGTFGAEAAARRHFGKPARDLTRREAVLLAASLPNPLVRNPGRPSVRLRALAGRVQSRVTGTPLECLALADKG